MTFLNKKEEVLSIVLTRYGRISLMKGKYDPVFYRFFDDGVIYDPLWSGTPEKQNDAESRIKEAPMFVPQYSCAGVETTFEEDYEHRDQQSNGLEAFYDPLERGVNERDEANLLKYPLSNTRPGNSTQATFTVMSIEQPFVGDLLHRTGSGDNIPVAEVDFEVLTRIEHGGSPLGEGASDEDIDEAALLGETVPQGILAFADGTYYESTQNPLVFSVIEENTLVENDKFELEVFEEISGSLHRMYFSHPDDFRLVSDHFEILVDEEVDSDLRSFPGSTLLLPSGIFNRARISTDVFQRLSSETNTLTNVYSTLPSDADVEDCE